VFLRLIQVLIFVNRNLIASNKVKYKLNNCSLRYPTKEKVVIKEKIFVKVRLGKYIVEISMLVPNINDNCILGVDFLKKVHLENIFKTIFSKQEEIQCGRLENLFEVPSNFKYLLLTQSMLNCFKVTECGLRRVVKRIGVVVVHFGKRGGRVTEDSAFTK